MTLFAEQETQTKLEKDVIQYTRHLAGDYDYILEIEPMATPRPRSTVMYKSMASLFGSPFTPALMNTIKSMGWVNVYHPSEYTKYKEAIAWMLKDARLGLKPGDYSKIFVTFYFTYPASTPQKHMIDGAIMRKKPDWDNLIKGFQDALSDAGMLLTGDGALCDGAVRKRYTIKPNGYIAFNLF